MTDTTTAEAANAAAAAEPANATEPASVPEPASVTEPATTPAGAEPAATAGPQDRINRRRIREGKVISVAMEKTAVVETTSRVRHSRYKKIITRKGRLYVHDPHNDLALGDTVKVQETRPLSKQKRWRILEILERAR